MKFVHRIHPSRIATISITFGAGSRVEFKNKYPAGIAHYMEHMRFKGTDKYTAKEMAKAIAKVGGDWNAFTSEDIVNYHVELPEENIEKGFECLAEIALRPIFPDEEIKKEIEVVCQEVRAYEDDMGDAMHKHLYSRVFSNALANPVIGTEESVKSITKEHLMNFNKEFYFSAGSMIVVASNMPHADLVEKYFGIPDNNFVLPPPEKDVKYADSFYSTFVKEGFKQYSIAVAYGSEAIRQLPKTKRAASKVFNYIFGGGADARLFMKVREDLGLVYGIYSSFQHDFDGSLFLISTSTEPENYKQVLDATDEVVQDMLNNPPTEEEMTKAKNMIKSQLYRMMDTSSGVAMNALSEEIHGYVGGSKYLAEVEAVTVEQVMDVAKTIFNSNQYVVVGKGE